MSTENVEQIREKGRELKQRLDSDPAFRNQVMQDPRGALTAAGLPEAAVQDFTVEVAASGEVQGFCTDTCTRTCVITCIVTLPSTY